MNAVLVLEQFLNGVQFGVTLFLLAAGLTLVFGIMNLVNLAHGSLYMVGAYVATSVFRWSESFLVAMMAALAACLVVGMVVEIVALRTLYERDHLDQVLATFGLILVFNELVSIVWGRAALYANVPAFLAGHVLILPGVPYPTYRVFVIAIGLLVAGCCTCSLAGLASACSSGQGPAIGRWWRRSVSIFGCCTRWCSGSEPGWRGWPASWPVRSTPSSRVWVSRS